MPDAKPVKIQINIRRLNMASLIVGEDIFFLGYFIVGQSASDFHMFL
jgi:hypothetical protein